MDQSSRCSSPASPGRSSKRPKLEPSIPSTRELAAELECQRLKAEVAALHCKLFQIEATASQHYKIRKQMEDLFDKEKKTLEVQIQLDKVKIKQLSEELELSKRIINEAREAQAATEEKLSRLKTIIERQFTDLMSNWNSGGILTSSKSQENPKDIGKDIEDRVEDMSDAKTDIVEDLTSEQKLSLQNIEVKEQNSSIEMLNSKEQNPDLILEQKREGRKSDGDDLQKKHPQLLEKSQEAGKSSKLKMAHYLLIPSSQFFRDDWKKHVKQLEQGKWACDMCKKIFEQKGHAEYHIWLAHYKERRSILCTR